MTVQPCGLNTSFIISNTEHIFSLETSGSKSANLFHDEAPLLSNNTPGTAELCSTLCSNVSDHACGQEDFHVSEHTDSGASSVMFYVVGFIMLIVFALGILENGVVFYVYARNKKVRTVSNVFIVGLSLSDIGQAIFNLPLVVIANFSKGWIFGYGGCMYYGFVTTTFGLAQISLLTVIALERYCIIVHHTRVFSSSMTKACLAIAACFLYASGWALGPLIGWSEYKIEKFGTRCAVSWEIKDMTYLSYTLCLFTFVWFIPLFLITFGYTSIACMIRREKLRKRTLKPSLTKKATREQTVALTVLLMIGAFVISWLPYSAVALYTAINGTKNLSFAATLIPALIAKSSIIWNPIIYVVRHRDFRKACIRTLKHCVFCDHAQQRKNSITKEYTQRRHLQENFEGKRKKPGKTSASSSSVFSSRDSRGGTKDSGLLFDSCSPVGRDKLPKLTSKDSWKHSPHPVVKRIAEQKVNLAAPYNKQSSRQLKNYYTETKLSLRRKALVAASVPEVSSAIADTDTPLGTRIDNGHKTSGVGVDEVSPFPVSSETISYSPPLSNYQPKLMQFSSPLILPRASDQHISTLTTWQSKEDRRGYVKKLTLQHPTVKQERAQLLLSYRWEPKIKSDEREYQTYPPTTDYQTRRKYKTLQSRQNKYKTKNARVRQQIEMTVYEMKSHICSSNGLQCEPCDPRFNTDNSGHQDIYTGACRIIRQSNV